MSPANSKGLQPTRLPLPQSATEATWFHSFKSKYLDLGSEIVMPYRLQVPESSLECHMDFPTRKSHKVVRPDAARPNQNKLKKCLLYSGAVRRLDRKGWI